MGSAFYAVIGEIGGHSVSMQLRIEFAARVVTIRGHNPVAGRAIFICPLKADAVCRIVLSFRQGFAHRFVMGRDQALVSTDHCLNRNRLCA